MDVFSILSEIMEEAKISHDPYSIEQLITGAVVIWNIPSAACEVIEKSIRDDIKVENIKAIKLLTQNGISLDDQPYNLYVQNANIADRANMRLHLQYGGPRLRKKIAGVYTTKDETKTFLHTIVKKKIDKYKLTEATRVKQNIKIDKPADVTHQSRFVKMVGKHTAHDMIFMVTPNRRDYLELVDILMPKMINNIIITPISINKNSITYRMNAAGKPYLVRIGQYLDERIAAALRKA